MFAAFYAGMRDMSVRIVEASPALGGRLNFYSDKRLFDVGGIESTTAHDLGIQLERQTRTFSPEIVLGQAVEGLSQLSDGTFRVTTNTAQSYDSRTVIVATGGASVQPVRLDVPDVDRFEGVDLFHWAPDVTPFRDQRVLISGGGDTAVDYAATISEIASSVTLVHRRDEFRAHEGSVRKMREAGVEILTPFEIHRLHGTDDRISQIDVRHNATGEMRTLVVDKVLISHGVTQDLGGIAEWGLDIDDFSITVDPWMRTSRPGIFAAGDGVEYDGRLNGLLVSCFAEGPLAVNSAKRHLTPGAELPSMWSTFHSELLAKADGRAPPLCVRDALQVGSRTDAESSAERCGEGTRGLVAHAERDLPDRIAVDDQGNRRGKTGMGTPLGKSQAGLFDEKAQQCARAGSHCPGNLLERTHVPGIAQERVGDIPRPRVGRQSQLPYRAPDRLQHFRKHLLGCLSRRHIDRPRQEVDQMVGERRHGDERDLVEVERGTVSARVDAMETCGTYCTRGMYNA
jgi:thioredoxin reductase (NADPH)